MSTQTIGVGIISFDRPEYLQQLLLSLEANTDLHQVDFHLFQDGPVNFKSGRLVGSAQGIGQSVRLFKASALERKSVHVRLANLGIAINQYRALDLLTGHYQWVVLLEDDVVLSPYYLRLSRILFAQLSHRDDVASFSLGFKKLCPRHQVHANKNNIMLNCGHWWGEGLWSSKWARARPFFDEYIDLVRACDYALRPHKAIAALFEKRGWPAIGTTQDAAKDMAISAAGMQRARAVVNRGISIGEQGQHFSPGLFRSLGFDHQEPYVFESDAVLDRFEWRR